MSAFLDVIKSKYNLPDLHNPVFNAIENRNHIFTGKNDMQIIQLDMLNYILVTFVNDQVTVYGMIPPSDFGKKPVTAALKKRYQINNDDNYNYHQIGPNVCTNENFSAILCCAYLRDLCKYPSILPRNNLQESVMFNWFVTFFTPKF